jgi:hypothetical protein
LPRYIQAVDVAISESRAIGFRSFFDFTIAADLYTRVCYCNIYGSILA